MEYGNTRYLILIPLFLFGIYMGGRLLFVAYFKSKEDHIRRLDNGKR